MTDSFRKRQWAGEPVKDLRRQDQAPPAAKLPGKATGKKQRKLYGYSFQYRSHHPDSKWKRRVHWGWYATEKQRDDAMRAAGGFLRSYGEIRNVEPITRDSERRGDDR